ncbi:MAG: His/Gly/Thr/Pro-type tRNA ligase C-terminal domain-containing protein, partial [Candidatus Woesearchaeota archaeon]
ISAFESATLDSISDFDGAKEIEDLFTITKQLGLSSLQFNPVLARGLSYYTGTVYEVKLHNNPITSTVCAGGRYDTMIGNFLDSKESYPAVGVSFGLSRIFDALKAADKVVEKKTVTDVFVISMQEDAYALDIVSKLRDVHINTETDIMDRKLKKNLEYANALGIPFVIIVGENEAKDNLVTLKDLSTGDQKLCSLDDAITIIKKL